MWRACCRRNCNHRSILPVECRLELAETLQPIAADPELLHRAFSNLALNAMDAMPQGGTLTLRTRPSGDRVWSKLPTPAPV